MIAVENLMKRVGGEDWPRIFDLRGEDEAAATPRLLPAARRVAQKDLVATVAAAPGARAARHVVVCQKGGPRAEAGASALRLAGYEVESLEGGVSAWLAAGGASVSAAAVSRLAFSPSRWATRARPKIDRVACPWLIRRFIDPWAEFHYVAAPVLFDAATILGAEPFDAEGARLSHAGEACSFDAFIAEFDIRDAALERLALIVRAADTGRLELAPEAAGLVAISLGLSVASDRDERMLERAMAVYDGLYARFARAARETHNWPPGA